MKTFLTFIFLYLSVFIASAQRYSDFPNNPHPGNGDIILFQSGNTNFNTSFSQLQSAIYTNIGTSSNSVVSQFVTGQGQPLTNSILGNAATASAIAGALSNTNLPNPLDLTHGSNLPPAAIASGGASSGQTLSWNGSAWVPSSGAGGVATNVVWPVIGDTHLVGVTNGLTVTMTVPWTPLTNQYWIQSSATTNGDGTMLRPFDGSTQSKFDALMVALYTNGTVIHLGAGEYRTLAKSTSSHVWVIPSNSRLIGAGNEATSIKVVDNPLLDTVILSDAVTNAEICDLKIDCNGANIGSSTPKINGIYLSGAYRSAVRRVHVVHQRGDADQVAESFGILADAGNNGVSVVSDPTARTIIDSCIVSDVISNDSSAIAVGAGCDAINCYVQFPIITNAVTPGFPSPVNGLAGFANAYNVSGNDTRILNCSSYGGMGGVFSDSWALTNIIILGNTFREFHFGVAFDHETAGKPIVGAIIANNTFIPSSYGQSLAGFKACIINTGIADRNFIIAGNRMDYVTGSQYAYAFDFGNTTGITIYGNVINDALLSVGFSSCSGYNVHDNFNLNGQLAVFFDAPNNKSFYQTNYNTFIVVSNVIGGLAGGTNLPLSGLSQSGATAGYVPTWSGSAWVPQSILTNKVDGTNLISGGPVTAGKVPVADGTGKVIWGGVSASQSPLTNNVNGAGFSATNYGTIQATNIDVNGTGSPVVTLGNNEAGYTNGSWFGSGASLTGVIPSTRHVNKISNYQLLSADTGTYFNNFGAGATMTNTLPVSAVGLHYYFVVAVNFNVTVQANNPDVIMIGNGSSSPGGGIYSPWAGDVIHVFCPVTNLWFCDGVGPSDNWNAY